MLHIGALQCLCYSNHIPFRFVVHLLMFWQLRCLIHRIREINKRNNFGTITLLKECQVLHFGDRLVELHTPYTVCILLYTILLKSTMCYCYKKNVHVHFISRMMKMDILYHVFCFFYIECYSMPLVWAYLSSLQSPASYLTFNLWRTPPPPTVTYRHHYSPLPAVSGASPVGGLASEWSQRCGWKQKHTVT